MNERDIDFEMRFCFCSTAQTIEICAVDLLRNLVHGIAIKTLTKDQSIFSLWNIVTMQRLRFY